MLTLCKVDQLWEKWWLYWKQVDIHFLFLSSIDSHLPSAFIEQHSGILTSSPLLSLFLSILSCSLSLALCVNGKVRSSTHSRVLDVTSLLVFLQGRMLISSHWSLWATRWMDWWHRYSSRRICIKYLEWPCFSVYDQKCRTCIRLNFLWNLLLCIFFNA